MAAAAARTSSANALPEPAAWAELQSALRTIEADRIDLVHLSS
jgi:hypothetical protein